MIAINTFSVMDQAEMKERMTSFCQTLKNAPMWDASKEMLLPGEIEYRNALEREEGGIPLPPDLYDELVALGSEMGVTSTLPRHEL